jgi:hypothetical protein
MWETHRGVVVEVISAASSRERRAHMHLPIPKPHHRFLSFSTCSACLGKPAQFLPCSFKCEVGRQIYFCFVLFRFVLFRFVSFRFVLFCFVGILVYECTFLPTARPFLCDPCPLWFHWFVPVCGNVSMALSSSIPWPPAVGCIRTIDLLLSFVLFVL